MTTFSIIIPTLNEANYIGPLLEDLTRQTFTDFEVIIVDAQSEDDTRKKVKAFAQELQLALLTSNKKNVCHQRNLGAGKAKSDWLIFMDADNRLPSYFLQGIKYKVEALKPDILTTYAKPDSTNSRDKVLLKLINAAVTLQKSSSNPYIMEAMIIIPKETFHNVNGFDPSCSFGEGQDLIIRAHKQNIRLSVVKEPKYTMSLRRLRKDGTIKVARNLAEHEISRIFGYQISHNRTDKLYPMQGGAYFDQVDSSSSTLQNIFNQISQIKSLPAETKKIISQNKNLTQSFKQLINLFDTNDET